MISGVTFDENDWQFSQCCYNNSIQMSESPRSPKYKQVYDELRREIISGHFKTGEKLPSEAALVKRFGASRITVGRAVRDLRQEGLVQRRAGSGTYVQGQRSSAPSSAYSFGLLIPDLGRTEIFEPICQGMSDAPEAGDHALLWGSATADDGQTRQQQALQLCQRYIDRQVSGVFFAPLEAINPQDRTNYDIIDRLARASIPVVLLDRDFVPYPKRSRYDLVGIDNRRTGFLITEHLIQQGCRRIAFLSFTNAPSTVDERIAGYREALLIHGLPVETSLIHRLPPDDESATLELARTLDADGYVCANDRTAGRLMQALLSIGRRIPADVRIAGIDDIAYASLLPVPLTTMHQPCREIGITAMSTMLERIRRPKRPARDILVECHLIVRKSCGSA